MSHPVKSALPFLGVTGVMLTAVVFISSCTLCYTVDAQGRPVAFFHQAETYDAAVSLAEGRASAILDTNYSFPQDLTVRATLAPRDSIEALPQVTDSLMEIIPELEHVYTLSVDGVLVGAAADSDTIQQALATVKDTYTTPETRSICFDSQVRVRYQYLPAETGVSTADELVAALLTESPRTFSYTTQEGDTLESLTGLFTMSLDRLQELNPNQSLEPMPLTGTSGPEFDTGDPAPLTAADLRQDETVPEGQPGDPAANDGTDSSADGEAAAETCTPLEPGLTLTVEQSCPRLLVSTVEEQTKTQDIIPERQTQPDDTMFTGEERIIQEGEAGEETVLSRVMTRCGLPVARASLSKVTLSEAIPLIVGTGTQPMPQLPDGCLFLWPVRGPITSDYGYRFIFGENNFHRGVDIAAAQGTAINAADAGTVVFAGEKGTYGNLVILAHSSGFYTYYGHCSKLLVTQGQEVTRGEPIAAVGSTGRSTGPHCHFEVHYQSSLIDPLLYLPGANNAPVRVIEPTEEPETEEPVPPTDPVEPELPAIPVVPEVPIASIDGDPAPPEELDPTVPVVPENPSTEDTTDSTTPNSAPPLP